MVIWRNGNTMFVVYFKNGNESYADIFGITIQAKMLDAGTTDWTMSDDMPNDAQSTRSLSNPNSLGVHFSGAFDINGNPVYAQGQPDTYHGNYYYDGNQDIDYGGTYQLWCSEFLVLSPVSCTAIPDTF